MQASEAPKGANERSLVIGALLYRASERVHYGNGAVNYCYHDRPSPTLTLVNVSPSPSCAVLLLRRKTACMVFRIIRHLRCLSLPQRLHQSSSILPILSSGLLFMRNGEEIWGNKRIFVVGIRVPLAVAWLN